MPSVTLNETLRPGAAITGSYADLSFTPTDIRLTDHKGNAIGSKTGEITNLAINTGGSTFSFTMPALPAGETDKPGLLYSPDGTPNITVELTD